MFHLGVIDHVRLNLGCAARNYTVHAKAAERLAALTAKVRVGVLALVAVATAATMIGLVDPRRPFQVAAVIAVGLAFAAFASYLALGLEARVHSHRSCAHRLWMVCDRHRALLGEIHDGLLDRAAILQRRDELGAQVHAVYEQAFPPDQIAYEAMRQTAEDADLPEELSPASIQSKDAVEASGSVRH